MASYSGKIVAFVTMPVKNNVEIYTHVYRYDYCTCLYMHCNTNFHFYDRELCLQYGLWDQIRVDHGKEFYLMLYVQEKLSEFRRNTTIAPHMQSTSRQVSTLYIVMIYLALH